MRCLHEVLKHYFRVGKSDHLRISERCTHREHLTACPRHCCKEACMTLRQVYRHLLSQPKRPGVQMMPCETLYTSNSERRRQPTREGTHLLSPQTQLLNSELEEYHNLSSRLCPAAVQPAQRCHCPSAPAPSPHTRLPWQQSTIHSIRRPINAYRSGSVCRQCVHACTPPMNSGR